MAQTYDLILKNGIVVNQDGIGKRDIGVKAGGLLRLAVLTKPQGARLSPARGCMSCRA